MFNRSFKTTLLRSTILVGAVTLAAPGVAQETTNTAGGGNTEAVSTETLQEITVTGSLIRNPNLVRSTPVTVTSAEEIELKQSNVAEDVLRQIPGVVPSIGSAVNNGNNGASFVDLRGLGSNRNIVLLNGDRLVPADLVGRVDLNNIPLALIERVESLTGAASTTYGADAISGVVNFITKSNFSGIDFSASEQITERGDGNYYRADLTIGGNFADDKGNAVLSVGYQQADPVYQGDRSYSINNIDSFSGTAGGSGTGIPTRISGTRPIDPATGQPSVLPSVVNGGVRQVLPSTGQAVATYNSFNFNPFNIFQTPFKRFNIFGQASYDVSDNIQVYSRGLFSKNTVNTIIAPSGVFGSSVTIPLSNPYLPAALRNQLCAFNVSTTPATTYVPRFTPAQCAAAATALSPTDPNYRTVDSTINRRTTEVGPRISEYVTTVFDYQIGARGSFTDHLDWDVQGAYGESENRQTLQGYVLTSRVRQAALATNTTTCLNDTNGCVPINLFGPEGSITAAQGAFLTAGSTTLVKTSLGQFRATLSGDFGVTSPAATDPISFAVGGEYRDYKAQRDSDLLAQTAGELGGAGGAAPNINGGYDVKEGFAELVAPLIQDKPFFQSLTLEAGIRYSSYEVNAPGTPTYKTTTYKGGGSWEPGAGLKVRGNYSRAVRAPNIGELFSPVNTGLTNLATDPCAGAAPTTNADLRAVCLAQGAPAGTIGSILNPTAGQANSTGGGNIALRPETANTYTVGAVFQPTFFSGFSMTVDYFNIKVKGAVSSPTPADAINACFSGISSTSASNPACTIIRRNPTTGGLDGDPATTAGLFQGLSNLGRIATDGIDLTANYSSDIGFAKLGLSFLGTYTFNNKFQASPSSLNRECIGFYSVNCASIQPKYQWTQRTTLGFDTFDISLQWRHLDGVQQEPDDVINGSGPVAAGFGTIKSFNYFDLTGRVSVVDNLTLTLTVQNLLDKQPPIVGSTVGSTLFNSGNTYPSTYDALGRRYAMTARLRF